MTHQDRLHRQDPVRSEPIRNRTTFLRNSHSWGDLPPGEGRDRERAGERPPGNVDDVLTHGVNLGYKIIDEHILQGRRVAEDLRNRSHFRRDRSGEANGELHALVARLMGLTKDMGALCFDSLEIALKSPLLQAGRPPEAAAATPAPVAVAESNISVEIASSRRTQVTLNLPPRQHHYTPQVHALHAANPAFPPLTAVRFEPGAGARAPVLVVEIPEGQSPSTYTGVVVEKETNEPVGTLVIRIQA